MGEGGRRGDKLDGESKKCMNGYVMVGLEGG